MIFGAIALIVVLFVLLVFLAFGLCIVAAFIGGAVRGHSTTMLAAALCGVIWIWLACQVNWSAFF